MNRLRQHASFGGPRNGRGKRPTGFTMIEVLLVVTIVGVSSMIVLPKLAGTLEKTNARSARDRLASMFAIARATATMTGQNVYLKAKGDSAWVVRGTANVVVQPVNFMDSYGVNLTSPIDSIAYGPRGLATNLASTKVYTLRRNEFKDSICVNMLGQVAKRCGL